MPLQRGFDLPTTSIKPGSVPVVYSNGVGRRHNKAMAKGPGVITGRSGTIGQVHYVDSDFWPHNTALWVTNFKRCYPMFTYYYLQYVGLERFASGSGVPTLNRNDAHSFEITIPESLDEQREIASALADVDELIAALKRLIAKKQAIKQGMMQRLLTGITRFPEFTNDWSNVYLGDVLTVRHGKSQKAVESLAGGFPILATGGQIGWARTPLYSEPSVLIGRKGTIDRPQYQATPFWTVDTLFYTEISALVDPKYLYYVFLTVDWRSRNEASGVPSLNASQVEGVEVQLPDIEEQIHIRRTLDDANAEVELLRARLMKTRDIKQGMMQELLSGRTRLSVQEMAA